MGIFPVVTFWIIDQNYDDSWLSNGRFNIPSQQTNDVMNTNDDVIITLKRLRNAVLT